MAEHERAVGSKAGDDESFRVPEIDAETARYVDQVRLFGQAKGKDGCLNDVALFQASYGGEDARAERCANCTGVVRRAAGLGGEEWKGLGFSLAAGGRAEGYFLCVACIGLDSEEKMLRFHSRVAAEKLKRALYALVGKMFAPGGATEWREGLAAAMDYARDRWGYLDGEELIGLWEEHVEQNKADLRDVMPAVARCLNEKGAHLLEVLREIQLAGEGGAAAVKPAVH